MVSVNTEEAIVAFKHVLQKEYELNEANKDLSSAVLLVPLIEMRVYEQRTEELRRIYGGRLYQDLSSLF